MMLNDNKTEILHLTSRFTSASQLSSLRVSGAVLTPSASARDLGAVIDEHATMSQHESSVCRSVLLYTTLANSDPTWTKHQLKRWFTLL